MKRFIKWLEERVEDGRLDRSSKTEAIAKGKPEKTSVPKEQCDRPRKKTLEKKGF
jgi:hypothetical protein